MDFAVRSRFSLLALAAAMLVLWLLAAPSVPTAGERALWDKVRAAQQHLVDWRKVNGTSAAVSADPRGCGLIGVEWSPITTTLGDLEAKRTACDPAWAIRFLRWYRELGLEAGDRIAIYSSASFPGLLYSSLAAAESYGLEPFVIVSLGASTWGANHPDAPWPVLAAELRRGGFLRSRADFYTLGGNSETGGGMAPEGRQLLRAAAFKAGVGVLDADGLEDMTGFKTDLLASEQVRLLVNIGGSHANLGGDPDVLELDPGLHLPGGDAPAGNGVIGRALESGVPVIHALNIRELAGRSGIPFDALAPASAPADVRPFWLLTALALFFGVLLTHRRWRLV